ncbi:MAG: rRNA pseudouridine synthase, partial [Verrucomicrobiae bacterium]|nr:rRNA pseudouridine synthase [Verrucomicrobiae bacterium]
MQKFLADAGVASRREAEKLILDGQVAINGHVVRALGTKVVPGADTVTVDGRPARPRRKLYVALNKPPGYLCSRRDPNARRFVAELLPREWAHLFTVGRLDRDSEGLLLLTNDGEFSLRLTHPRYGVTKRYHAWVAGRVLPAEVAPFTRGLEHDGETLRAERVQILEANNSHSTVEL